MIAAALAVVVEALAYLGASGFARDELRLLLVAAAAGVGGIVFAWRLSFAVSRPPRYAEWERVRRPRWSLLAGVAVAGLLVAVAALSSGPTAWWLDPRYDGLFAASLLAGLVARTSVLEAGSRPAGYRRRGS